MICPTCGVEVPESKQCPECGAALLSAGRFADHFESYDEAAFTSGDSEGYWKTSLEVQPAEPAENADRGYFDPSNLEIDELIFGGRTPGSSSRADELSDSDEEPAEPAASNAAFAFALAGLVVGVLTMACIFGMALSANGTFVLAAAVPMLYVMAAVAVLGFLCSVVGAALNFRSSKSDLANPRGATVNLLGGIGLIVGAVALALLVLLTITAKQAFDAATENGWDVEEVQVMQGTDGTIVIRERSESASGSKPLGVLPASSSSASPSASSDVPSETSLGASGELSSSSSANSGASASAASSGSADFDALGNPTLRSLVELNGSDLQVLLKAGGFGWYDEITAWLKSNGAVFQVVNRDGNVSRDDIDKLAAGASGAPVAYVLSAEGYATPQQALAGLAEGVTVEARHEGDGAVFAVVHGLSGERFLVLVTSTGDSEQTVLVYGEAAIRDGLFRDTIGIDAGTSVADAWAIVAV